MIWVKIDEFLMSADPFENFLKIIWDPRLDRVVSKIMLYRTVIYQGSSVHVVRNESKFIMLEIVVFKSFFALHYITLLLHNWKISLNTDI